MTIPATPGSAGDVPGAAPCPARSVVPVLLACHVAAWSIWGAVGLEGSIHEDMAETWAWGQELALGYHKHPPLAAWMAWAWFQLLPREDWAFQLLAACNGGLGLLAVACLAAEVAGRERRAAAIAIATLTPLYGVLALKLNANSILLALWPLATLLLARSLRTGAAVDAALLGIAAGAAMLGKYYSALLLAAFLPAAVLHPSGARWWRSPSPWIAAAAGLAVLAPHVWWMAGSDWLPFRYAAAKFGFARSDLAAWTAVAATGPVLFLGLASIAVGFAARVSPVAAAVATWQGARQPGLRWLGAVALVPFVLTLLFGLAGAKVSLSYLLPAFFAVPVLLVACLPALATPAASRRLVRLSLAVAFVAALVAPLVGELRWALGLRGAVEPRLEAAVELERQWRERFGRPPALVAGSTAYAGSMPFYARSPPSHFIDFDRAAAPWVTPARLAAEGLLVVCEATDERCIARARAFVAEGPRSPLHLTRLRGGKLGPPAALLVHFVAPR